MLKVRTSGSIVAPLVSKVGPASVVFAPFVSKVRPTSILFAPVVSKERPVVSKESPASVVFAPAVSKGSPAGVILVPAVSNPGCFGSRRSERVTWSHPLTCAQCLADVAVAFLPILLVMLSGTVRSTSGTPGSCAPVGWAVPTEITNNDGEDA